MRNRNLISNKLDNLEAKMKTLKFIVSRGEPIQTFLDVVTQSEELISELQDLIDREDLSPNELNRF
jgi:hypothetical protein